MFRCLGFRRRQQAQKHKKSVFFGESVANIATRVSESTGHHQMKKVVGDLLRDRPLGEHQPPYPPEPGEHLLPLPSGHEP